MKLQALVFDAYGTLYDVHSVIALCERFWPGRGAALSQAWRAKQLEYTWLRSLMRRYVDFRAITEAGLRHACASLKLDLSDAEVAELMLQYLRLDLYPEARIALDALRLAKPALGDKPLRGLKPAIEDKPLPGRKLAILSNGAPGMLAPLVKHSGLEDVLDLVLSVDELKIFKPDPAVYQLAVERLALPKEAIGFVSSNCWDACGAKTFGFRTFWINRAGAPLDSLGATPDHTIARLTDLAALVD